MKMLILIGALGAAVYLTRTIWQQPSVSPPVPASAVSAPAVEPPRTSELTWEPVKKEDIGPRRQYVGQIRQHFSGGELLMHCGSRLRADSGAAGDYVLVDFPGAASLPDDRTIDFYARAAGVTTYPTVTGASRTVVRLVFSPEEEAASSAKRGDWMWDKQHATKPAR